MTHIMATLRNLIGLLTWTLGIPALLIEMTGALAATRPSTADIVSWINDPLQPRFIAVMTVAAGWLLWAVMAWAVLLRGARRLPRALTHGLRRVHVVLPRPVQGLSATLLGAAAITTPLATTAAAAAAAPVSAGAVPLNNPVHLTAPANTAGNTTRSAATSGSTRGTARTTTAGRHNADTATPRPTRDGKSYIVRHGDTLFGIAARRLGDSNRWPEIFALNRGARFTNGHVLRDPDLIYPDSRLRLPPRHATTAAPPGHTARERPVTPPNVGASPTRPSPPTGTAPLTPGPATPTPASPADDGIASSPAGTPTPAAPADDPAPSTPRPSSRPNHGRGVTLPDGGWIDLSLASAITAAAALVWLHRRRRYRPQPPAAARHDTDLTPLPPVIACLHRSLTAPASNTETIAARSTANPPPEAPRTPGADPAATAATTAPGTSAVAEEPATSPADTAQSATLPPRGLGLVGPGALAAARGQLTAALAAGIDEPHARTRVITTGTTLTTLLGPAAGTLPNTPRLTVTANLNHALALLETEALHRSRLLHHHDADTLTAVRAADLLEDPAPPLLLLTEPADPPERGRTAALLHQGHRLDIHGVFLGDWPDGHTITVDTHGSTTPHANTTDDAELVDVGRLTVLETGDTIDLITTLAESHTGEPATVAYADTDPHASPRDTAPAATAVNDQSAAIMTAGQTPEAADDQRTDEVGTGPVRPINISVLGPPAITGADPSRPLRAKSLELLVYLAVHNGTATVEAILDDLLPDAPASKALHRLHTYISDLRAVLRCTGGPGTYLTHPRHRYTLNTDTLDIDLWRMNTALRDASTHTDPNQRTTSLRAALDCYTGPLADGHDYEWIEPYREANRRRNLDAALALVAALHDRPADQLTVLDTAIAQNPYTEELYQAAMRTRATLGQPDAIRDLRHTLARRLADIDTEPSDTTLALADQLITTLKPHQHDTTGPTRTGGHP